MSRRLYLVNPEGTPSPKAGRKATMAKRMPQRGRNGRFLKRSSAKRKSRKRNPPKRAVARRAVASNPPRRRRRRATASRAAPRRRYRRNPPRGKDIMDRIITGAGDALALTGAQAIVRLGPGLLKLPRGGPVGLAISTAAAVIVGIGAEQFLSRETARIVMAGALSVPLQQATLQYIAPHVPLLTPALTPTLGRYPRRLGSYPQGRGMGSYPRAALPQQGMAGYDYAGWAAIR